MVRMELFGVIGQDVFAEQVKAFLAGYENQPVTIAIDSPGGNLSEGVLIYNLLKAHRGSVTTVNLARCYSIASYIFLAGDQLDSVRQFSWNAQLNRKNVTCAAGQDGHGHTGTHHAIHHFHHRAVTAVTCDDIGATLGRLASLSYGIAVCLGDRS